jgi:hypothetical protein
LVGQVGSFWFEWDIEFRGPTDNQVARTLAAIVDDIELSSVVNPTIGTPIQFVFSSTTSGAEANYTGPNLVVAYIETDLSSGGPTFSRTLPIYLGGDNTAPGSPYFAYTSLFDAVQGTAARRIVTTAVIATPAVSAVTSILDQTNLRMG